MPESYCLLNGFHNKSRRQSITHAPAHYLPGKQINDHEQIQPAFQGQYFIWGVLRRWPTLFLGSPVPPCSWCFLSAVSAVPHPGASHVPFQENCLRGLLYAGVQQILMYPKAPGYVSDLSPLCYKSYCFFLKLPIVLPASITLLHFTPPKVILHLTFRCVHYIGGSSYSHILFMVGTILASSFKGRDHN